MSDKVKKISEFPEIMADNVKVLGVSQTGENVRVRLDIKQGRGSDTGALMSQAGITAELARQDAEIKRVSAKYGYYVSEESLLAVNPIGTIGDRAYVGVSAPYAIYEWNGYAWENTGMVSEDSDVNNKADKDGTYPQMTVGFAKNIVGDGSATPEVFSFRPTAGENRNTLNDGAARIKVLKGSSVVVNNRLTTIWGVNGGSLTNSGFKYTFTASNAGWLSIYQEIGFIAGHKYLFSVKITLPHADTVVLGTPNNGNAQYRQALAANTPTQVEGVVSCTESYGEFYIYPNWNSLSQVGEVYTIEKPIVVDLTQMFGVGNEPTTVAEYYQRMPIGIDLAGYNVGEIVNGNYKAIKATDYNQWDGVAEAGFISYAGANQADTTYMRSANYTRVLPNTPYFINLSGYQSKGSLVCRIFFYDADKQFISYVNKYANWANSTTQNAFTTPANAVFVRFTFGLPIEQYNNDISINLSWDEYASMNGTYKPYKPFVRDLSWVAKYFPNGMRSAGNVADEIRFNSTEQRWEAVQRVGVRAYASGDENDSTLITDGKNTNYPLTSVTPIEIAENINLDYDCSDYGTEELLSDGVSAPLSADIVYEPNVLATIKNLPDLFARLAQMEAMVSAMAVSTTNMNE